MVLEAGNREVAVPRWPVPECAGRRRGCREWRRRPCRSEARGSRSSADPPRGCRARSGRRRARRGRDRRRRRAGEVAPRARSSRSRAPENPPHPAPGRNPGRRRARPRWARGSARSAHRAAPGRTYFAGRRAWRRRRRRARASAPGRRRARRRDREQRPVAMPKTSAELVRSGKRLGTRSLVRTRNPSSSAPRRRALSALVVTAGFARNAPSPAHGSLAVGNQSSAPAASFTGGVGVAEQACARAQADVAERRSRARLECLDRRGVSAAGTVADSPASASTTGTSSDKSTRCASANETPGSSRSWCETTRNGCWFASSTTSGENA